MDSKISNLLNKGPSITSLEAYELMLLLRKFIAREGPVPLSQFSTEWPLMRIGLNSLMHFRNYYLELKAERKSIEEINKLIGQIVLESFKIFLLSEIEAIDRWLIEIKKLTGRYDRKILDYYFQNRMGVSLEFFFQFLERLHAKLRNKHGRGALAVLVEEFSQHAKRFPYLHSLIIHAATGSSEYTVRTTSYFEKKSFVRYEKEKDNLIVSGFLLILMMEHEATIAAHLLSFLSFSDKLKAIEVTKGMDKVTF